MNESILDNHIEGPPTVAWAYDENVYPGPVYFRGKPVGNPEQFAPYEGGPEIPDILVLFIPEEPHPKLKDLAINFGFSEEDVAVVANGEDIKFSKQRNWISRRSVVPYGIQTRKGTLLPAGAMMTEFREDCVRDVILNVMQGKFDAEFIKACKQK